MTDEEKEKKRKEEIERVLKATWEFIEVVQKDREIVTGRIDKVLEELKTVKSTPAISDRYDRLYQLTTSLSSFDFVIAKLLTGLSTALLGRSEDNLDFRL